MSRRPRLYCYEGEMLSAEEIAGRLGVTRQKLFGAAHNRGVSVSVAAKMLRDNMIGTSGDRGRRYCVDGKWVSARGAAEALGLTLQQFTNYRWKHRDPETGRQMGVAEAVERLRQAPRRPDGKLRRGGSAPRIFERIDGRRMSVEEAAREYGISKWTLYGYRARGMTMAQGLRNRERRRMRKAEREIMEILTGGGS